MTAPVAIIMGSQSDWATMRHAAETLDALGVAYGGSFGPSHPRRLYAFAGAKAAGFKVIIAGAGGAAHLPGMAAAMTALPVFGVPVESKALAGVDQPIRSCRCRRAFRSARSPSAAPARSTRRCWRPPCWPSPMPARRPGWTTGAAPDRRCGRAAATGVTAAESRVPPPGGTVGILGGGQLGRMLALAAARLGLPCQSTPPIRDAGLRRANAPAPTMTTRALPPFAAAVDVVTYEFENVPAPTAISSRRAARCCRRRKGLAMTQDRLDRKEIHTRLGIGTAAYAALSLGGEPRAAIAQIGRPAVLKTRRFGYDGKGQTIIRAGDDLDRPGSGRHQPAILEAFVPFEREISVWRRAPRRPRRLRCGRERPPRPHPDARACRRDIRRDRRAGVAIAETDRRGARLCRRARGRDVRQDGAGADVLVNEIAPRVHNSGHWTLDGCLGLAVRAAYPRLCRLAARRAGTPRPRQDDQPDRRRGRGLPALARREPGAAIHLYGKGGARPGRKMGHVTEVLPPKK